MNTNGIAEKNPIRYRGYYYDTETSLYYLKTRYYDPEVGRFMTIDGIEYLDPETINGLNLYAYCGNNPVMNIDPEGTWSWKKFWKILGAVVIVGAITVAVVFTAGAAAVALGAGATVVGAVTAGAAVGGLVAGGGEIINQIYTNGIDQMNFGSIAIESFTGAVFGAVSGAAGATTSAGTRLAMKGAKIILSGVNAALHGWNNRGTVGEIFSAVGGAIAMSFFTQIVSFVVDISHGSMSSTLLETTRIFKGYNNIAQMVITGGTLAGKSIWRNTKTGIMNAGKSIMGRIIN